MFTIKQNYRRDKLIAKDNQANGNVLLTLSVKKKKTLPISIGVLENLCLQLVDRWPAFVKR